MAILQMMVRPSVPKSLHDLADAVQLRTRHPPDLKMRESSRLISDVQRHSISTVVVYGVPKINSRCAAVVASRRTHSGIKRHLQIR